MTRDPDEPLGLTRGQRLQSDMIEEVEKLVTEVTEVPITDKTKKVLGNSVRRIT